MPTIGKDNGVSIGKYNNMVAILKYCYISAGSKECLNLYLLLYLLFETKQTGIFVIL